MPADTISTPTASGLPNTSRNDAEATLQDTGPQPVSGSSIEEAERPLRMADDPQGGALSLARRRDLGEAAGRSCAGHAGHSQARRRGHALSLQRPPSTASPVKTPVPRPCFWRWARWASPWPTVWRGWPMSASSSCATPFSPAWPRARCVSSRSRRFQHIHALSLRYHITRRTGGLSRIIERGVKGVEFLLRFFAVLGGAAGCWNWR